MWITLTRIQSGLQFLVMMARGNPMWSAAASRAHRLHQLACFTHPPHQLSFTSLIACRSMKVGWVSGRFSIDAKSVPPTLHGVTAHRMGAHFSAAIDIPLESMTPMQEPSVPRISIFGRLAQAAAHLALPLRRNRNSSMAPMSPQVSRQHEGEAFVPEMVAQLGMAIRCRAYTCTPTYSCSPELSLPALLSVVLQSRRAPPASPDQALPQAVHLAQLLLQAQTGDSCGITTCTLSL